MTYIFFALGLLGLFFGGEFLVRGAVGIARRIGLSPLVIGLTIVGFGTSAPELLVSVQAALAGAPALAIGNVIGSNIANVLLILGLTAIVMPVPLRLGETWRDFATMIGVTLVVWAMLFGGEIARWQGMALVAGLLVYLFVSFRRGKAPDDDLPGADAPPPRLLPAIGFTLGGLVLLVIGARFLVTSATEIATAFGISEAVIGLTIVAVGTSLPELATSVMAALRRHPEIAIGNILGSNVFNLLGILGLTAVVEPIPVEPRFASSDMVIAAGAALIMLGFALVPELLGKRNGGRVGRIGGAALLTLYAGYVAMMV